MHPQANTTRAASMIVIGSFINGDTVCETIQAESARDAAYRVIAACRYSDGGGDLNVQYVKSAATHQILFEQASHSDLTDDVDAVFDVVTEIRGRVSFLEQQAFDNPVSLVQLEKLKTYLSFFELIIQASPESLVGVCGDELAYSEEDLRIDYEDEEGNSMQFVPADALKALAEESLKQNWNIAAVQCLQMASFARSSLSLNCIEALTAFA